ncbi:DNA polymerase IV [Candidatus Woesearchaeota archaeon]|nr:DNA polymerase IV [Candidatus Woesearchaeota archaeon]
MIIAHIDMDCFFCACELKRDYSLKGKPVIVGGLGKRGVVSTSNYLARRYGVFSAQPICIARKLCPDAIYLTPDHEYYSNESSKIMDVLSSFGEIEQVSIDEAYIDVTEFMKIFSSLEKMTEFMQRKVLKKTGLTCSIGISTSRYVSKIASDFKKPFGYTIVLDPAEFLSTLNISKIPGIGKVSKLYYNKNGINTIGDLANMNRGAVLDKFGKSGLHFQNIALGLDKTGLLEHGPIKSSSRETTYQEDVSDFDELEKSLANLSEHVISDAKSKLFKTVSVKIRYSDFTTRTKDYSFNCFINSIDTVKETCKSMLTELFDSEKGVRLLGVKLSKFANGLERQLSLTCF